MLAAFTSHHTAFEPVLASSRDKSGSLSFTSKSFLKRNYKHMKFIRLAVNDAIATVTLNNPGGNRVNFQMRKEILDAFEQVAASEARVLLIKGEGSDFCLGGDIREWPGIPSPELRPHIEVFARAIDLLDSLSIPTVAVVRGGCMGGGFELALGCDLIVAAASARFVLPEAMLGIMQLQGGAYLLAERIGRNKAIELVMLSTPVEASQMAEWNVVNTVVEDDKLEAAAAELAQRLATGAKDAFASTKKLLRIWRDDGRRAARAALYDISMPLFDTPDVQTALTKAVAAVKDGHALPRASFPAS